jgi:hypothetical protein
VTEQQIDFNDVVAEMSRDPLSKALLENAQMRVIIRQLSERVDELTKQHESPQS